MSFGDAIARRAALLRKRGADVDRVFQETAKGATIQSVRVATEKTPPTADNLSGTNTRRGGMKEHWAVDSETNPIVRPGTAGGTEYVTTLANNKTYASYVNNGHRMDKHFVPGLILDPVTGRLERGEADEGGIMVGTKTTYVQGAFMTDAARDAYEDAAKRELGRLLTEVFKP